MKNKSEKEIDTLLMEMLNEPNRDKKIKLATQIYILSSEIEEKEKLKD